MKILAVGDIHLGRRPSRLPDELQSQARDLGPAGAWERLVEAAIRETVDAVVLAGDVVEREDDFFEGYRELEKGVRRLSEEGIRVAGIGGNHDMKVLPRLADRITDFHMLGRDGIWEPYSLEVGGEKLVLWGWSYPRPRVNESPLDGVSFDLESGVNIGLLHCDCNQAGSIYAPVTSMELTAAGLDGWLLGHIHKPDNLTATSLTGYLGSITGMDPGEPGARGPWVLTIEAGSVKDVTQWTLAPLRWERLEVDLTGIDSTEEARDRLLDSVNGIDEVISGSYEPPEAVGLRVVLTGRCNFGEAVRELLAGEHPERIHDEIYYFIERLELDTRPEISLADLAKENNPPGLLARRLLLLDRDETDPERESLLKEASARMKESVRESQWRQLGSPVPDEAAAVEWLREAGTILLEKMLAELEEQA
ncbi:MAG: metallophosphoesterase family protein [Thermoleophilia bacterium]